MFKRIIGTSIVLFVIGTATAYGHLTGAFVEFLSVVYDKATISKLQTQLEHTKSEIEALTPTVETAKEAFQVDQAIAGQQLQYYENAGMDVAYRFLKSGHDVTDFLSSKWLLEQQIDRYLNELDKLYLDYKKLELQQSQLQGQADLLHAIERNLQARETYLQENEGLELEVIANYLDIDWTSEVEEHIIADLKADAKTIIARSDEWLETLVTGETALTEQWLNEQSNATYYFREDHLYIEYEVNKEHVILLGQLQLMDKQNVLQLQLEAGFYNGFFLPNELLIEIEAFKLPLENLANASGLDSIHIQPQNGYLKIIDKTEQ